MTMIDKDVKELLSKGSASRVDLDPSLKNEITRAALDRMVREIKAQLARKKTVSVIVVTDR